MLLALVFFGGVRHRSRDVVEDFGVEFGEDFCGGEEVADSCDSFGLMRVNVPSALNSSISKLIFHFWFGRAQRPSNPEYSLIGGTDALAGAKGGTETKPMELSAFSVQPAGRLACETGPGFTTAQEPRAAEAAVGPG